MKNQIAVYITELTITVVFCTIILGVAHVLASLLDTDVTHTVAILALAIAVRVGLDAELFKK